MAVKWRVSFPGLKEYQDKIHELTLASDEYIRRAVYDGADVVADKVRDQLEALPTISEEAALAAYRKGEPTPLTVKQKKGLGDSLGLAKMRDDSGYIHTKLGFMGYNSIKTKKYPNGQPNALIARAAESGSTAHKKTPFLRPGVSAARKEAEKAMKKKLDEEIQKIMK